MRVLAGTVGRWPLWASGCVLLVSPEGMEHSPGRVLTTRSRSLSFERHLVQGNPLRKCRCYVAYRGTYRDGSSRRICREARPTHQDRPYGDPQGDLPPFESSSPHRSRPRDTHLIVKMMVARAHKRLVFRADLAQANGAVPARRPHGVGHVRHRAITAKRCGSHRVPQPRTYKRCTRALNANMMSANAHGYPLEMRDQPNRSCTQFRATGRSEGAVHAEAEIEPPMPPQLERLIGCRGMIGREVVSAPLVTYCSRVPCTSDVSRDVLHALGVESWHLSRPPLELPTRTIHLPLRIAVSGDHAPCTLDTPQRRPCPPGRHCFNSPCPCPCRTLASWRWWCCSVGGAGRTCHPRAKASAFASSVLLARWPSGCAWHASAPLRSLRVRGPPKGAESLSASHARVRDGAWISARALVRDRPASQARHGSMLVGADMAWHPSARNEMN